MYYNSLPTRVRVSFLTPLSLPETLNHLISWLIQQGPKSSRKKESRHEEAPSGHQKGRFFKKCGEFCLYSQECEIRRVPEKPRCGCGRICRGWVQGVHGHWRRGHKRCTHLCCLWLSQKLPQEGSRNWGSLRVFFSYCPSSQLRVGAIWYVLK